MTNIDIKNMLTDGAKKMGVSLDEVQTDKLIAYKNMLIDWNTRMNLTAITENTDVITKHFLDSLTPLLTGFINGRVIDVGTGAGFPGLVLKIAKPEIHLTLLDSLNKRLTFLQAVSDEIGIPDIEVVHARAEDAGNNTLYREKFDTAVSRAVANMTLLAELTLPFVRIGGRLLALKGPLAAEELDAAKRAVHILGGEIEDIFRADIPFTDLSHSIVIIKKVRHTPNKYPRKPSVISKNPITSPYNKNQKYK